MGFLSKIMKKCLVTLMTCCVLLFTSCGYEKQIPSQITQPEESETLFKEDILYELAEYDKFNSPATENGLDGTLIKITGKMSTIGEMNGIQYTTIETQDGNWILFIGPEILLDVKEVEKTLISGNEYTFYGIYIGKSSVLNMPVIEIHNDSDYSYSGGYVVDKDKVYDWYNDFSYYSSEDDSPINSAETTDDDLNNVSSEYKDALSKAISYNNSLHLSKKGLFNQLTSEYGANFSEDAANYAIENIDANWKENALLSAESYNESLYLSQKRLYKQLTSEHGGQFTEKQAEYAIKNIDADWKENALKTAKSYQKTLNLSGDDLYRQLTSEYGANFTEEEAQYAINQLSK